MAQEYPYFIPFSFPFAGNGTLTDTYQVSPNERIHIRHWLFTYTSANFIIYDIRLSGNVRFTNANQSKGLQGTHLQAANSPNIGLRDFETEFVVEPANSIFIDILNSSGAANPIFCTLWGTREYV